MSIEQMLRDGNQTASSKELDLNIVVEKLMHGVKCLSKRKDLAQKICKSSRGRALQGSRVSFDHDGEFVLLPRIGDSEFCIKIGTAASIYLISRSHGGDGLIGGTSWSSSTLTQKRIKELRDNEALQAYCALGSLAIDQLKPESKDSSKEKEE